MSEYVDIPIQAESVPQSVQDRVATMDAACRYYETIDDEGWFMFDRASAQWFEKKVSQIA